MKRKKATLQSPRVGKHRTWIFHRELEEMALVLDACHRATSPLGHCTASSLLPILRGREDEVNGVRLPDVASMPLGGGGASAPLSGDPPTPRPC